MSSHTPPSETPIERSATGYRTEAQRLRKAAAQTPNSDTALALDTLALGWRMLAIEADWQTAMLEALANVSPSIDATEDRQG